MYMRLMTGNQPLFVPLSLSLPRSSHLPLFICYPLPCCPSLPPSLPPSLSSSYSPLIPPFLSSSLPSSRSLSPSLCPSLIPPPPTLCTFITPSPCVPLFLCPFLSVSLPSPPLFLPPFQVSHWKMRCLQSTNQVKFAYTLPQQQSNQEDSQDDTALVCVHPCACVWGCVSVYLLATMQ